MNRILAALLFLASAAAAARAASIDDPGGGFHIDLDVSGADVCVIHPREARDPAKCTGLDVEATEQALAKTSAPRLAVAAVRSPAGACIVFVTKSPIRLRTKEQLDSFVKGVGVGFGKNMGAEVTMHGDAPGSRYDALQVGSTHVLRFACELEPLERLPPDVNRGLYYAIVGPETVYTLAFTCSAESAAFARTSGEAMIRSVRTPPLDRDDEFGQPRAFVLGKIVGELVCFVVFAAGVVGAIVVVVVRSRRGAQQT